MTVWSAALSLSVLGVATVDDLRTKKIHNALLLALALISIGVAAYFGRMHAVEMGLLGAATGFLIYLPLAWAKIVGGGDLKLLAVAGLSLGLRSTFMVGFYALLWASFLGLVYFISNGQIKDLFSNLFKIASREKIPDKKLHTIPYSTALFLAALTEWTLTRHHGEFL